MSPFGVRPLAGELLSECELAEGAKLWWLPEPWYRIFAAWTCCVSVTGNVARAP